MSDKKSSISTSDKKSSITTSDKKSSSSSSNKKVTPSKKISRQFEKKPLDEKVETHPCIKSFGDLHAFHLPKSIRGDLYDAAKMLRRPSSETAPASTSNDGKIETDEATWSNDPVWLMRPRIGLEGLKCDFKIYRSILAQSSCSERGVVSGRPHEELKKAQLDGYVENGPKWTLLIFGQDEIAGMVVDKGIKDFKQGQSLTEGLVVHEQETIFIRTEPTCREGKKGSLRHNTEKPTSKSSRRGHRVHDTDAMTKRGSELLKSWEKELLASELIFVWASKKQISIFFPDSSPFKAKLRAFPFTVGSPCIGELRRCYKELVWAKLELSR